MGNPIYELFASGVLRTVVPVVNNNNTPRTLEPVNRARKVIEVSCYFYTVPEKKAPIAYSSPRCRVPLGSGLKLSPTYITGNSCKESGQLYSQTDLIDGSDLMIDSNNERTTSFLSLELSITVNTGRSPSCLGEVYLEYIQRQEHLMIQKSVS